MPQFDLAGRSALVTGAAGQLGRHIVAALLAAGARVVAVDQPGAALGALAGQGLLALPCDLTDDAATQACVARAWDAIGPISIMVNAVGRIHSAPLVNIAARGEGRRHSVTAWRETIEANLTAVFIPTAHVVDRMAATRTKGVVVSLSSIAASGNAGQGAYAAAKAGVNAMTTAWAKELGLLGIRFVAVAPGFIDTPSTHEALSDAVVQEWKRRTPLRKLGQAKDVADAVLFAIGNAHLTGKVLEIDGGLTL
jgi:3-oxoacyl-[acyl-carrier protein] reductase